jgi:hypothetical protein
VFLTVDLPPLFVPGRRLGPFEAIMATGWPAPAGPVLVVVRRPVSYGQAAPAVFFVEVTP